MKRNDVSWGSVGGWAACKCAIVRFLGKLHLLKGKRVNALLEYIEVENSKLFNATWYLRTYPDVSRAGCDPVWHYCTKGWKEGRAPSPGFDGKDYLRRHLDVRKVGMNPLVHYIRYGVGENRIFLPAVRKIWTLPPNLAKKYRPIIERVCPRISVIVASYNYAKLIGDTLDSLLAQTYRNFEVIVVDDGSKDESVEVIGRYVSKYPNVKLYTHEGGVNRGLPATIRLGISKATGRYLAFCESDDIWTPSHLEAKIALVNKYDGAPKIVINDIQTFGDEARCLAANNAIAERMAVLNKERNKVSALDFRKKNWICTFSCCMVDRETLAKCDFDSCPRPSNLDWWLWRQVCCDNDLFVVHRKLTKWRMHKSYMVNESIEALQKQRDFIWKMDHMLVRQKLKAVPDLDSVVRDEDRCAFVDGCLMIDGSKAERPPAFSVVMATYNRAFCICDAVDSLLKQTYQNFELVIVDDGSTDGTEALLVDKYPSEFASGKIRCLHIENVGVCKARNEALRHVKNEWIAYLDSDNQMTPFFLESFVREMIARPDARNFYARLIRKVSRENIGREFDLEAILRGNFIDLGVYVHHRDFIDELGPFDENMTRFVDWELIVRQCKVHTPVFIDGILLLYNDSNDYKRITNSASQKVNLDYFRRKHCGWPTVTTIITTYNHERYIRRAIESALAQRGEFIHEIIVSDDGSTDGTRTVIQELIEKHPGCITDISSDVNLGISANMRKCFTSAKGDYVAVLEGDDYWFSMWKLNRQVKFMRSHPECSMCFSRIKLRGTDNKFSFLSRQEGLPEILTGEDFIRDPNQNLIANFSSCMFKGDIVRGFPDILYSVRFNEIACAFYIEQKGPIGFLSEPMSVYRIHDHGVWSACDRVKQIESSIKAREVALAVSAPRYQERMRSIIEGLESSLNIMVVKDSDLFCADWYRLAYPDISRAGCDPAWHYCTKGWKEGRAPSPAFDGEDYLSRHLDVRKMDMNPLVHYIRYGASENRTFVPAVWKIWTLPPELAEKYRSIIERVCPRISVIVASYNYAKLIGDTLDGLLAQTYRNFEVIVVDDGSKDESVEVIGRYVSKYPNVKLCMHAGGMNRGLPATVKLGLSKATGRYVAFCESDDIWMPNHLEEKVALVNKYGGEPKIIINDVSPFGDEGRCRAAAKVAEDCMSKLCEVSNRVSAMDFRERNWICTFSCCMVDRDVLEACDFDACPRPANLDWWLWRQICCKYPIYVVHEKLTQWRMHESFMAKESVQSILLNRQFLDRMDRMLLQRYPCEAEELSRIVEQQDRFRVDNGLLLENGVALDDQPSFSVIMPTYNRAFCIGRAIDSLLRQTYQNFELVIVDDGSTDGTDGFVRKRYGKELESGKIKYHYISNRGVCKARNYALGQIANEWIVYLDSDNEMCDWFLEMFSREIVSNPGIRNFYAKLICRNSKRKVGHAFNLESLIKANFIDLGVYVHHRSLLEEVGAFDENMTRLVDWDLIVRQSKVSEPLFLDEVVLVYSDDEDYGRITNSVALKANMDYFRKKHCNWPTVTTVITTYNHEKYIRRAIESAIEQKGEFVHEILVSDDGSTDGTRAVIQELIKKNPGYVTDISSDVNLGISANMRKCFISAKGDYVAVLEGDDYWISEWKLNRQVRFMRSHPECSMCFSRIKLLGQDGKFSLLPRHNGLPQILTGENFIRDQYQNLIANFSCCLFNAEIARNFPDVLYSVRFNEICCAFYIEQIGPIGFLPDLLSVYRLHDHGVWSACDRVRQIESAIKTREVALQVCAPQYRERMQNVIDGLKAQLRKLQDKEGK